MSLLAKLSNSTEFLYLSAAFLVAIVLFPLLPVEDTALRALLVACMMIVTFFGLRHFNQILESNLTAFFAFLLIHVAFAVDSLLPGNFQPHILAVGLATLTGANLLIRDFRYFWGFPLFRCLLVFFAFSFVYLFCYGTEFTLSAVSAGYPIDFMADSSDTGARSIVFLASYVMLLASITGLSIFKGLNQPEEIQKRIYLIAKVVAIAGLCFFLLLAALRFQPVMPGHGNIVGLFFMLMLSMLLWVNSAYTLKSEASEKQSRFWQPSFLILLMIPAALISLVLSFNKSSLAGYSLSLIIFLALNQIFVPDVNMIGKLLKVFKGWEAKVIACITTGFLIALAWMFGLFAMFTDKLDYFTKGFSSMSTMRIREGNWHYFITDWLDTLTPFKAIFGYGLGQSRESIFYISAMRQAGDRTLVQTVHNSYIEHFYDYGLLALLMYGATLAIVVDDILKIINPKVNSTIKIFSILSLSSILYIGIYSLTDGARIHMLMVYYAILAFVESMKLSYSHISSPDSKMKCSK